MAGTGHVPVTAAPRALVVAAEATGAAALAHWSAGGMLPDGSYLLGLAAVVFAGAMLLLTRTASVALVGAVALAAQVGLHVLGTTTAATHTMAMAGGHVVATPAPALGMLAAHGLTAVVVTLLLVLQDQAACRLGFAVRARELVVAVPGLRDARPASARPMRRSQRLHLASPRRGPPLPTPTS